MNGDIRKIRLLMELRKCGVSDTSVLTAMEKVPREQFVPETFKARAYENIALPIDASQTISQPQVVAEMTAALELDSGHKVLEVGTGSGYQAAVLAHLSKRLYTIERHRILAREAEARFDSLRLYNIVVRVGDGNKGWLEQAPFDRIIVTAQADRIPDQLVSQLRVGGIIVLPVLASNGIQNVIRMRRTVSGYDKEVLMEARFVPLVEGVASTIGN